MITLKQFEKVAFPLYDYTASGSRAYVPASVKEPHSVVENNSGKKLRMPEFEDTDVPKWGHNIPSNADTTTYPYWHSFAPTVSGTGGGRQLWSLPKNPYEN